MATDNIVPRDDIVAEGSLLCEIAKVENMCGGLQETSWDDPTISGPYLSESGTESASKMIDGIFGCKDEARVVSTGEQNVWNDAASDPEGFEEMLSAKADSDDHYQSDFDSMFGEGTDDEQPVSAKRVVSQREVDVNHQHPFGSAIAHGVDDWNEFTLQGEEGGLELDQVHNWLGDLSSGCGRPDLEEDDEDSGVASIADAWENDKGEEVDEVKDQEELGIGLLTRNTRLMSDNNMGITVGGSVALDETCMLNIGCKILSSIDAKNTHERLDREDLLGADDNADLSPVDYEGEVAHSTGNKSALGGGQHGKVAKSFLEKSGELFGIGKEIKWLHQADDIGLVKVPVSPKKGLNGESASALSKDCGKWEEEELGPDELSRYVEALDVNESYVDTVLDMEDVLLEPEGSGGRFSFMTKTVSAIATRPARDGSLSASSSGMNMVDVNNSNKVINIPMKLDWIEVVGARQIKGGASLGERIVGVKDHTVYCIKVRSGKREWDVERRYRDFVDLYHQLKSMLNAQSNTHLPTNWQEVEKESRKVFGSNSPNVVEQRSALIQTCLHSLLLAGAPFNVAPPLFWFLTPTGSTSNYFSGSLQAHSIDSSPLQRLPDLQVQGVGSSELQSLWSDTGSSKTEQDLDDRGNPALGKTIGLVLHVNPRKSLKQLLYAQHYSCAGCYKQLDVANGLMQGFVQNLGWGKPRICEYSGQLFCTSCHLNETAVLPAQVLQRWDFTPKRVSQLAKAYLDSIYDQPNLCTNCFFIQPLKIVGLA